MDEEVEYDGYKVYGYVSSLVLRLMKKIIIRLTTTWLCINTVLTRQRVSIVSKVVAF